MLQLLPAPFAAASASLFFAAETPNAAATYAAIFTGIASVIASTAVLITAIHARKEATESHAITRDIQTQVTTLNGRSIAELADQQETRRIENEVPPADRTDAEEKHVVVVPPDPAAS